jgi:hypothetical protein
MQSARNGSPARSDVAPQRRIPTSYNFLNTAKSWNATKPNGM